MGFSSVDDLVSKISQEKIHRADWFYKTQINYITNSTTVGLDLSSHDGSYGSRNLFPGTALNWRTCDDNTGNGTQIFGIPHGGNTSPETKHLISVSAIHPPTGLPATGGVLVLVDLQGYWPGVNNSTTATQTLIGTPSLRYANGAGCRLYLVQTAAPVTGTYNINCNYVNQSNNVTAMTTIPGKSLPQAGLISSSIPGVGTASALYFPLINGDTGIINVNNITLTTARAGGTAALCLARPICTIPLTTGASIPTERDFVYQTPSMPRIHDGACLTWLYFSGTGSTTSNLVISTQFSGHIETAWG